jgi:peptidoglycan/LPS O-acetylase OafA/YrhL
VRQRQLDGVRGVAILSVFLFHHFFISAGWMGVDLFFVLSGFLITRTLWETKYHKSYWAQFYIKRAGRILPPLIPILLLALMLSRRVTVAGFFGYAFFLGNYMNLTRYHIDVLNVLWSLAIEEHYYLLWPAVVRFLSRKQCIIVSLVIIFAEPFIRMVATPHVSEYRAIYSLTWFRLDGLASGSLLALVLPLNQVRNWLGSIALWMSASFVALYVFMTKIYSEAFVRENNTHLFNSFGYSIVTLGCFFLVAHLVFNGEDYLSRLLSTQPFVLLGEISYGMYLLHMLTMAILRRVFHIGVGLPSVHGTRLLFLVNFPLVICLTWLSFRFYESPIIKWSRRKARIFEHAEIEDAART